MFVPIHASLSLYVALVNRAELSQSIRLYDLRDAFRGPPANEPRSCGDQVKLWPLPPEQDSVAMKSARNWARAAWVKCIWSRICNWKGPLPSRFYLMSSPAIASACIDLCKRLKPRQP